MTTTTTRTLITALMLTGAALAAAPEAAAQPVAKERITWNTAAGASQSMTLYDAGSNYTSFRAWNYGAAWRLVGTAGNRILWQGQTTTLDATLWKIDDAGDQISLVWMRPPVPGYKARSIALASSWLGACYDRDDRDQAYWILWERDVPTTQLYVQLVWGDGTVALTNAITKPAAMGTRAALGLTQIYGNDLVVMFAQDSTRTSLWTIARATMTFTNLEWLFVTNPIRVPGGGVFLPSSLNAYYDGAPGGDGAMVQLLFNDAAAGPFQGRAVVVNVKETVSRPFGRQAIKREIWPHQNSNNVIPYATGAPQEASGHTITPAACP